MGHRALFLVDLQAQRREQDAQPRQHPLACTHALHVDVQVVGVANEAAPAVFERAVDVVEQDIRQQRRQRAALRRPFVARHHDAFHHSAGLEVSADQLEHAWIADVSSHSAHQHVVVDPVKELGQVHVDHDHPFHLHVAQSLPDRTMCAPTRPEPVTVSRERRVDARLHHLQQRLLNEPVQNSRDAELPYSALGLGDRDPPHRRRDVRAIATVPASLSPELAATCWPASLVIVSGSTASAAPDHRCP